MRIFVGYGGNNAQRTANILFDFFQQQQDWETFKAPGDVPIGEWEPSTLNAMKKADVFVVVYSKWSWKSQNLWKEIVLAEEWGIKMLPVIQKGLRLSYRRFPKILAKLEVVRFNPRRPKHCRLEIFYMLRKFELTLPYTSATAQAVLRRPIGI